MLLKTIHQTLDDYLSSMYTLSHSYSTVSSYRLSITNKNKTGFREFLKEKYDLDEFELVTKVKNQELDIYKTLNEFVVFLDVKEYKPKSIIGRLSATKGYLRYLGLRINSEDYKQNVRIPRIIRQREVPLTKELILRLLRNLPPKLQTIVLVLTASGMRIGELVQLKLSDIDFETNPTTINIRAETTKTKTERETFLTIEATESLKDYLRRFFGWKDEDQNLHLKDIKIFGRTSIVRNPKRKSIAKQPPHLVTESLLMNTLKNYLKKVPALNIDNANGRKVIHFHAFRKFFRTTVGNNIGRDFAEELIGHGFYMDTYYQLSQEKKRQMYLDAEPYLTMTDSKSIENNFKKLSSKYSSLETKVDDLMQYLRTNSIQVPENLINRQDS